MFDEIIKLKKNVRDGVNGLTVTLRNVKNDRIYRCHGGGYDMQGTCFGEFLVKDYYDRLVKLAENLNPEKDFSKEFYGLSTFNGKIYLDGACGYSCMVKIAKAIGLGVQEVYDWKKNRTDYILVWEENRD